MIFLIDVGNSRLKWRLQDEHDLISGSQSVAEFLAGNIDNQWNQALAQDAGLSICYASVANIKVSGLIEAWAQTNGLSCYQAKSQSCWRDLRNSYADCSRMGVDRWLAMVAVRRRCQQAACVVDCGSATTIDYIDASGMHMGGYILPGPRLMVRSLLQNTAHIVIDRPYINELETHALGKSTDEAVINGVSKFHKTGISALILAAQKKGFKVYATGGDSAFLSSLKRVNFDAELILDGLLEVAIEHLESG